MVKPSETGFKHFLSAAKYSSQGIKACWKSEAAFRQEVILSLLFLPLGIWLGDGGAEKALLAGVCLVVIIVELLNTSIEAVVDRIGHEHHELSGLAKDIGSAAVMISMILFWLVWGLILIF